MRVIVSLVLVFLSSLVSANDINNDLDQHEIHAQKALLSNINPFDGLPGNVIASPSRSYPDYYYHWVRDAALVMQVVLNLYERESDPIIKESYLNKVRDFVTLTDKQQSHSGISGIGEPKYYIDGRPYDGPWGRPQNDGPALRASMLIRFSDILTKRGEPENALLKKVIVLDLQYVIREWREPNFDLWEEVLGDHFYTRYVQRKALIDGEAWAKKRGFHDLAQDSRTQVYELEKTLETFKDPSQNILKVTINRVGGLDYKHSQLDTANILAVLHAYNGDDVFAPNDPWVLGTIQALQQKFTGQYPINKNYPHLGTAFGRYPEDRYYGGNPWFLTTFAVAENYYLIAQKLREQGYAEINTHNRQFYTRAMGKNVNSLNMGLLQGNSLEILVQSLIEQGDRLLQRGLFHSGSGGSMAEQMNLHTGFMESARDLTWSYASFITAVQARRRVQP